MGNVRSSSVNQKMVHAWEPKDISINKNVEENAFQSTSPAMENVFIMAHVYWMESVEIWKKMKAWITKLFGMNVMEDASIQQPNVTDNVQDGINVNQRTVYVLVNQETVP